MPSLGNSMRACIVVATAVAVGVAATAGHSYAEAAKSRRSEWAATLKKVIPSVVGIIVVGREAVTQTNPYFNHPALGERQPTKTRQFSSSGSGIIVSASDKTGLILTNFHVIENADRIGVKLADGRAFTAKLLGRDAATDIAMLRVDAPNLPAMNRTGLTQARVGDIVFAIGNPLGLDSTVTMGIVSKLFRSTVGYRKFEGFIQHDAMINPGNSGGALINEDGQLIGINTAIRSTTGAGVGLSFAQPIGLAAKVGVALVKQGRFERGEVGLMIQDLTPRTVAELKLPVSQGALITSVREGSAGEKAGLKTGDVIVEVGVIVPRPLRQGEVNRVRLPIISSSQAKSVFGVNSPGDKAILGVLRDGKKIDVPVEFTKITAEPPPMEAPAELKRVQGLVVSEMSVKHPKFGEIEGVLVADVKKGTIAELIGFLPGDIITRVNGNRTRTASDLFQLLGGNQSKYELNTVRGDVPLKFALPF